MSKFLNFKFSFYVFIVVVVILSGLAGVLIGLIYSSSKTEVSVKKNPLFSNQTAEIRGKITKVSGKTLLVKNFKRVSGNIQLADNFIIQKRNVNGLPLEPSSDTKNIEIDKDALINLEFQNGAYKAISIFYLPPPPPNI